MLAQVAIYFSKSEAPLNLFVNKLALFMSYRSSRQQNWVYKVIYPVIILATFFYGIGDGL
ncbi:hypothetical protein ATS76_16205 [Pseudoalteromonas sp. 10-33]|nr:hypothetical protein ATS76_16205 [Pseudoalteromonas sp. 10-33]